ncbi:MAG: 8-amino-7-oxononanoate synthase [Candidatus Schekmanbacteria bacterium]|nr:8-amino-7-oxononanoate synthase [Candidatus Schekmanbacteria bacterium]
MTRLDLAAAAALSEISAAGRLRRRQVVTPLNPTEAMVDGRRTTLFSSNDYLGLSGHPEVRAAAAEVALRLGCGPRGSALVCGYSDDHRALEEDLAGLVGSEAALVFPTGFAANSAVLASLGAFAPTIFSDELNHASLIEGCRLSRARVRVYRHVDLNDLEELLRKTDAGPRVVVTETVFSMDGDLAPLRELAALKARHDFALVVDEAHALLVLGAEGGGLACRENVRDAVDICVGTLSKAVGAQGGFAAASHDVCEWLLNVARSYIFSTGLPLPVVAAARAALAVARRDDALRAALWQRAEQLAGRLGGAPAQSAIFPLRLGDERRALAASRELLSAGVHVTAMRPPTVPAGTSRLRITVNAAHTAADIDRLGDAIAGLGLSGGA